MNKLTAKQQLFVDEYMIDFNATQSAVRAGYSVKTAAKIGSENLTKPDIQSAIQLRLKERQENAKRNSDSVLKDLETIRLDAMQTSLNKEGISVMIDRTSAIRALELEGKHYAMFTEKQAIDHTTKGQQLPTTTNLTPELIGEIVKKAMDEF